MKKNILCIIPARGGSKRLKGKNLKKLNNKELIYYPINLAKSCSLINKIIVSTECPKIAKVSKKYDADVPFMRPKKLATDNSLVIDTITYTLKKLEVTQLYIPDYIVLLHATNPLLKLKDLRNIINLAIKKNADSAIAITKIDGPAHPFSIRELNKQNFVRFWKEKEHYSVISKDRPVFFQSGNILVSKYETIMRYGKFEGKKNYPYFIDKISSLDIDTLDDFKIIKSIK